MVLSFLFYSAVVMARFATECLRKLNLVTTQLEVDLGLGTSDLSMRFGKNV